MPPGPRLIGGGTVRRRRAVGCLRTARPLMGRRRLDASWGGRRCPIALARPGRTPSPGRWRAAVTIGTCASAYGPGCPPVVTAGDQAICLRTVTPGHGTTGRPTRPGAVGDERPAAPGRVRSAFVAAAAHPVAEGGAGGPFLQTECSCLRRSTSLPACSVMRPAHACPEACVPAAPPPPVRPEGSPPALVHRFSRTERRLRYRLLASTAGSRRSVRPARRVVGLDR